MHCGPRWDFQFLVVDSLKVGVFKARDFYFIIILKVIDKSIILWYFKNELNRDKRIAIYYLNMTILS